MRAKIVMTSALIRFRYGKGYRYLTSVPVSTSSGTIEVQIFDTRGRGRVYAWQHSADGRVIVIEHRGEVSSPHAAVLSANSVRSGPTFHHEHGAEL
jgi:hypothetical protein